MKYQIITRQLQEPITKEGFAEYIKRIRYLLRGNEINIDFWGDLWIQLGEELEQQFNTQITLSFETIAEQ